MLLYRRQANKKTDEQMQFACLYAQNKKNPFVFTLQEKKTSVSNTLCKVSLIFLLFTVCFLFATIQVSQILIF